MKLLDTPDYYSHVAHLEGFELIINMIWFIITFYASMIVFIIMNALLTAAICWSLLFIFRLLGIPWLDGTTKGFINRS